MAAKRTNGITKVDVSPVIYFGQLGKPKPYELPLALNSFYG